MSDSASSSSSKKSGKSGGTSKKSGGFADGLKSLGAGILEGIFGGGGGATQIARKPSVSRQDPVATNERPGAVKQVHRRLKVERDAQEGAEAEHEEAAGAEQENAGAEQENAEGAEQAAPEAKEEAPPIAAKVKGVNRKIFRAAAAGAGAGPAASTPFTAATAKAAMDGKASEYADLSNALATDWVGKTQTDFDTEFADKNSLQHKIMEKFLATGGDNKSATQKIGSPDPIAVQKFQDIDAEAHIDPAHGDLKEQFYQKLADKMKDASFTDRTRTYPAMKDAAGYSFNCKGKKIPADRLTPLSARNHSIDKMFDINTIGPQIDKAITDPLVAEGITDAPTLEAAKTDPERRKKAYRNIIANKPDAHLTVPGAAPISPYPTWYAPGEIIPDAGAPPNAEFARMMTLGALQPEWYPTGTVVLNIERKVDAGARSCFKPTAFDGLMSSLWCARNMGADDYGVTGGGLAEFLEAAVPFSEVTSSRAVVPTDDFIADMQRLITQVKNKLGNSSTPTEEVLRGNGQNTSIMNTSGTGTGGVKDTMNQVADRSMHEQNNPSPAPSAPGARNPNGGSAPSGPAAAPGGAFDQTNGPRAR